MSGFLTRMAERALGHAQLATPRIPSRFESLPEETGVLAPALAPLSGARAGPGDDAGGAGSPIKVPAGPTSTQFETVATTISAIAPVIGVPTTAPAGLTSVNPSAVKAAATAVQRRAVPAIPMTVAAGPMSTQFETVATTISAIAPVIGVPTTAPAAMTSVNPPTFKASAPAVQRRVAPDPPPEETGVAAPALAPLSGALAGLGDDAGVAGSPMKVPTSINPPIAKAASPAAQRRVASDRPPHAKNVGSSYQVAGSAPAPRSFDPAGREPALPSEQAEFPKASPQAVLHAELAQSSVDFPVPGVPAPLGVLASTGRSSPPNPELAPAPGAGRVDWLSEPRSISGTAKPAAPHSARPGGTGQPQVRIVAATTAVPIIPDQRHHPRGQTAHAGAAVQQGVEIHIGSVEIRATTPSLPAAAPAAPTTRSLDAYLAGKRR